MLIRHAGTAYFCDGPNKSDPFFLFHFGLTTYRNVVLEISIWARFEGRRIVHVIGFPAGSQ